MKTIDLHTHSTASDGTLTPSELIDHAAKVGLSAIAVTDHDTVSGLQEAIDHGKKAHPELEVVPGIEYSAVRNDKDVHIVGLYIDYTNPVYQQELDVFMQSRITRNIRMCEKLSAAGMPITYEELTEAYPGIVITRAHISRMLHAKGYVKSIKEAFDRYIGNRCPYYIPRAGLSPETAIAHILKYGGVPILAHPVLYGLGKDALDNLVKSLKDVGLVGIEALYGTYTNQDERDIKRLAEKYDLLISGGSDFHGANKPDIELGKGTGHMVVPMEVL
nr:PHP domain-containing protein [Butyrivibrio sp.]